MSDKRRTEEYCFSVLRSFVLNMVEEGFGTPPKPSLAVLEGVYFGKKTA